MAKPIFLSYLIKCQLTLSLGTSLEPNNSLDAAILIGHGTTVIGAYNLVCSMACRF